MFYVLYGNKTAKVRRELNEKRQEYAKTDIEVVKDFAMDIFSEDVINDTEPVTFVNILDESNDEIVFSIEGNPSEPKIYENKKYFKTS